MKRVEVLGIALLVLMMIGGCTTVEQAATTTTTTTSAATTTTAGGTAHALAGTWSGTWEDTVYSVQGKMSATITQTSSTALIGTGVIDFSHFGLSTIEAGTASATLSGSNGTFSFFSTNGGGGAGTITGNTIAGTGEVLMFSPGKFTFIGTIDATGMKIDGIFDFGPAGGHGRARVLKH